MMDVQQLHDSLHEDYFVLCGLRGYGAQLDFLHRLLEKEDGPFERRCLIDNRDLRVPLSIVEIGRLVRLASQFGTRLQNVLVAWVSNHECRFDPRVTNELPVSFRHFRSVDGARAWLRGHP